MAVAIQETITGLTFDFIRPYDEDDDSEVKVIPKPSLSSFQISGRLISYQNQVMYGDKLTLQLVDPESGEVVASGAVFCAGGEPLVHPKTEQTAAWTERLHKLKVGDGLEL